jgi:hypothetical protein
MLARCRGRVEGGKPRLTAGRRGSLVDDPETEVHFMLPRAAFLLPLVFAALPLASSARAECIALPRPIRTSTANTLNWCGAGASQHVVVPARLVVSQGAKLLLGGAGDPEELVTVERLQPSAGGAVDVTVSTRFAHPSNALVGAAAWAGPRALAAGAARRATAQAAAGDAAMRGVDAAATAGHGAAAAVRCEAFATRA